MPFSSSWLLARCQSFVAANLIEGRLGDVGGGWQLPSSRLGGYH